MRAYLRPSDLPSNLKLHASGNLLTWINLFIWRPHWRQSCEVWGYPKAAICEMIYMAMGGKRREPTTLGRTVGYQWQPGTIFRFMRTEKASNQRHKPLNTDYLLSSRHTVGNDGRQSKLIKLKKKTQKNTYCGNLISPFLNLSLQHVVFVFQNVIFTFKSPHFVSQGT